MSAFKALMSGKVQGVWFRDSTRQVAERLGLQGHAINLSDGRVEVLVIGPRDELERLLEYLHQGPPHARVDQVELQWLEVEPDVSGFRVG
ncbi:acylphosphatase [Bacterioplanes sanyensis]|uniref:acylphosphatase n=1 Tax=Bacterioplanes sanyensis TaxID=1249553 RepID=UPI00167570DC|nr:acylphosphatase [Bacterioplanes sanyensis]GGY53533.1 acylphosphatase [Bacterioplanes sanyensis]